MFTIQSTPKRPLRQLLIRLQARPLVQHGLIDGRRIRLLDQGGQGHAGLQQKTLPVGRPQPGVVPPIQNALMCRRQRLRGGQLVALGQVDVAAGRQQVPQVVVEPARPGKAVVDVQPVRLTHMTGAPDAGNVHTLLAQVQQAAGGEAGVPPSLLPGKDLLVAGAGSA